MGKKRRKGRRRPPPGKWDPEAEREYGSEPDIPTVLSADEILDRAFRKASKVSVPDRKPFFAGRKTAMAKLDSASATIGAILDRYISGFPDFGMLHPFHTDLYSTILDVDRVRRSIGALKWCKEQVSDIARKNASQIARSKSTSFIGQKVNEAYGRISSVIKQVGDDLDLLATVRDDLREVPRIDVDTPTIVVAGAPNVGKSLLVRAMSSGKPEVAPYPFTTKSVSVGHFDHRRIRFQVLDTPGILDRPLAERNEIEKQAVMALRHLARTTIFVIDPTGECGTDLKGQTNLLEEVREDFLSRVEDPMVFIALNKSDVKDRWQEPVGLEEGFEISAKEGDGVEELKEEVAGSMRDRIMDSDRLF